MNQKNEKLNKAAKIISRIFEICLWVAAGMLTLLLIVYLFAEPYLNHLMSLEGDVRFMIYSESATIVDVSGQIIRPAFISTLLTGIAATVLTAMIFRNICLIFKTTAGETKFSKGKTPFQPDNVRMLREIGLFAIAQPIIQFIIEFITSIFAGSDAVDSVLSLSGVFIGILLLCLSQFFAYGVELQSEQDGLL